MPTPVAREEIEAILEESHAFGVAWVASLATGLRKALKSGAGRPPEAAVAAHRFALTQS